jgi:hypothetical protein
MKTFTPVTKFILTLLICTSITAGCVPSPMITGHLLHNGKDISAFTKNPPYFDVFRSGTGMRVSPHISYKHGVYRIKGLPEGRYLITVHIDANMNNSDYLPGDYLTDEVVDLKPGMIYEKDLALKRIIQLVKPVNNNGIIPVWGLKCPMKKYPLSNPVTFVWEPLENADRYRYWITLNSPPSKIVKKIAFGTTNGTTLMLNIPPNGADEKETYMLYLEAFNGDTQIGIIGDRSECYFLRSYSFRVGKPE